MKLNNRELSNKIRVYHRYLGFFLAGIMFMYALSGITLTFRDKDYFKKEVVVEKVMEKDLEKPPMIRGAKNIEYNKQTGEIKYIQMQPPKILGNDRKNAQSYLVHTTVLFKCIFWYCFTLFCVFCLLDVSTSNRDFQKSYLLYTRWYFTFFVNDLDLKLNSNFRVVTIN